MAAGEKKGQGRDLRLPETAKIAQLLAELMPPGKDLPQVDLKSPAHSSDEAFPVGRGSVLALDEIEPDFSVPATRQPEPHHATPAAPLPEFVLPSLVFSPRPPIFVPEPTGPAEVYMESGPMPLSISPSVYVTDEATSRRDERNEMPINRSAANLDLMPLGNLTTAFFFSLMNWPNEPERVRHPRRSDFGLDEASLRLAQTIPFYVTGQPRVPDRFSVAAIMAEFVWE